MDYYVHVRVDARIQASSRHVSLLTRTSYYSFCCRLANTLPDRNIRSSSDSHMARTLVVASALLAASVNGVVHRHYSKVAAWQVRIGHRAVNRVTLGVWLVPHPACTFNGVGPLVALRSESGCQGLVIPCTRLAWRSTSTSCRCERRGRDHAVGFVAT